MNERSSERGSLAIGRIAVHGRSAAESGGTIAGKVGAAVAEAAAGATRSQRIEALRIELPAGAGQAEIARAIARALAGRSGR